MPRPRRHSDDEILAAARAVFLEHGPAASVRRVADTLGLSQPALFKRFGSKEVFLWRALAPPADLPWVDALTRGPDDRPMHAQLTTLCEGVLAFLVEVVPAAMTLRAAGPPPRAALAAMGDAHGPGRARRRLVEYLQRAVSGGLVRPVDAEGVADTLIGALEARAMHAWLRGAPLSPEAIRDQAGAVVDVCWRGLRPEEAP